MSRELNSKDSKWERGFLCGQRLLPNTHTDHPPARRKGHLFLPVCTAVGAKDKQQPPFTWLAWGEWKSKGKGISFTCSSGGGLLLYNPQLQFLILGQGFLCLALPDEAAMVTCPILAQDQTNQHSGSKIRAPLLAEELSAIGFWVRGRYFSSRAWPLAGCLRYDGELHTLCTSRQHSLRWGGGPREGGELMN